MVAIYVRKSVHSDESISCETQIKECLRYCEGEDYRVYKDDGYSGKNINRPDFLRLLEDVKLNKISKIIVYKIDRISRTVLDFAKLWELFSSYGVEFISSKEFFDTSTPSGEMLLMFSMVFAQMERKTIAERVKDAYLDRTDLGIFMGGRIPYGFKRSDNIIIGNVKTITYEIEPTEAEDIKTIYNLYAEGYSLGKIVQHLQSVVGKQNRRGKNWTSARLSELMRNPAYTVNDIDMYDFFNSMGCNIINPANSWDGTQSIRLYSKGQHNKSWDLNGQRVVISPHTGFIPSELWLKCRRKLLSNHQIKITPAKNTWLSGRIKCGYCNYALTIKKSKTKAGRYFVCTGHSQHICEEKLPTLYADEVENIIADRIKDKLNKLVVNRPETNIDNNENSEIFQLQAKIRDVEKQISIIIDNIANFEETTISYINKRISELDNQKKHYLNEISKIKEITNATIYKSIDEDTVKQLTDLGMYWDNLSFEEKTNVARLLVKCIYITNDGINIEWNF